MEKIEQTPYPIFTDEGDYFNNTLRKVFVKDGEVVSFLQKTPSKTYLYFISKGKVVFYEVNEESKRKVDERVSEILKKDGVLYKGEKGMEGFLSKKEKSFYFFRDDNIKVDLENPKLINFDEEEVMILKVMLDKTVVS